jgi:hypothetical protein
MHCIVLSAGVEGDPECLSDDYRQPAAPPHQLEKQPADGGKAGVGAARPRVGLVSLVAEVLT